MISVQPRGVDGNGQHTRENSINFTKWAKRGAGVIGLVLFLFLVGWGHVRLNDMANQEYRATEKLQAEIASLRNRLVNVRNEHAGLTELGYINGKISEYNLGLHQANHDQVHECTLRTPEENEQLYTRWEQNRKAMGSMTAIR